MSLLELFCAVDDFCQAFAPWWQQALLGDGLRILRSAAAANRLARCREDRAKWVGGIDRSSRFVDSVSLSLA